MNRILPGAAILMTAAFAFAKEGSPGVPVTVVATVEPAKDSPRPAIAPQDILVSHSNQRLDLTNVSPVRTAGMQLWVVIDDGSSTNIGVQLADLRKFIQQQPASTEVGVGYIHNGFVEPVQPLTSDHAQAAKAIHLPSGQPGISASPYLGLVDLIHKWPSTEQAREVLMITSGIDPDYGSGPENPYLAQAIDAAQRAGIVVHSLYYSAAGLPGRIAGRIYWGQNYLSELSQDTGGRFYWQGDYNPVALAPYLDDLNRRFDSQYLVTFLAPLQTKPDFESVRFSAEVQKLKVTGPNRVWVADR